MSTKKSPSYSRVIQVRITDELMSELQWVAERDRRSLSSCARVLLESTVKRITKRSKKGESQ